MSAPSILPIAKEHLEDARGVLSRAFCNTPSFRAAMPELTPPQRGVRLRRLYASMLAACRRTGHAWGLHADGALRGAALVYGPGAYPWSFATWLRNGLGALSLWPPHGYRLAVIDHHLNARHHAAPHWYLYVLGVDPECHGRGYGGALLRHLAAAADREHLPCYLETDAPANVTLYQRFGYEVIDEQPVPGLRALTIWKMLRPASG